MSKKMRVSLKELKVRSFVTALNEEEKDKAKAGTWYTYYTQCLECASLLNTLCNCGGGGGSGGCGYFP